jgi:hypothetical protein
VARGPRPLAAGRRGRPARDSGSGTADSGPGTLRSAITRLDANTSTRQLVIDFNIPTTGPGYNSTTGLYTISLKSALPNITHPFFLDGQSQPGFATTPVVVLDGSGITGAVNGLTVDETAGTFSSFAAKVRGLSLQEFDAVGIEVNDQNTGTSTQVTLLNNQITGDSGAGGILVSPGTNINSFTFRQNQITVIQGGTGVTASTGGTSTTFILTGNRIIARGGGDGIDVSENGSSTDTLTLSGSRVACTAGGNDAVVSGSDTSNSITFKKNTLKTNTGGNALVSTVSSSTSTSWTIKGSTFNPNGQGTGLSLQGGSTFQALVQGTNFNNNNVGVSVNGDGTTAGTVDLGLGPLGSQGNNNFSTFTAATATSYAIGLFSVASSYKMDAKSNQFTVSPPTVIADGSDDTAAGGSGTIVTS